MTTEKQNQVAKAEPSYSDRFAGMIVREFGANVGMVELSLYQRRLAQHLFIGIDNALRDLEAKRIKDGKKDMLPIIWANVNMNKLAVDAMHRIELGLDALIPGHIYPIPYFNGKTQKYDLDLRIGYVGKDYYRRKMSTRPPVDIIYELVHKNDTFTPKMKKRHDDIESYDFEIKNPFDRGEVIGGFGYIMYEDPTKNKLVMVSKADFDKSKKKAQSDKFWGAYEEQMQLKTLVHRVTAKLSVDPEKVNAAYMAVELDDNRIEIDEHANKGEILDIDTSTGEVKEQKIETKPEEPTKAEEKKGNGGSERVWLTCPATIDKKQPKKALENCMVCKSRQQCSPWVEYMMDQKNGGLEEKQEEAGLQF